MDVRLVDRSRNVTHVPTKTPTAKTVVATLDQLSRGYGPESGQIEFECDKAFWEALTARGKQDGLEVADGQARTLTGHRMGTYNGFHIILVEG